VVFLNHELGGLFVRNADGTGQVEQLTNAGIRQRPTTFSPDGKHLIVMQAKPGASDSDLYILSLEDGATSQPLIETQFDEGFAAISPNGQWIAYQSNETGRYEIYVRPFPNVQDGIWQISRQGGSRPRWGSYGTELFYRSWEALVAVKVESESTFSVSNPEIVLAEGYSHQFYDVSADGQGFLMVRRRRGPTEILAETELVVVENWFEELRRLAPVLH